MDNSLIICPHCRHSFSMEAEMSKNLEAAFKEKYNNMWKEEKARLLADQAKEREALQTSKKQVEDEREELNRQKKQEEEIIMKKAEEEAKKKLLLMQKEVDDANAEKIKHYEEQLLAKERMIKEATAKEVALMKKEQELKDTETRLALEAEKKVAERISEVEQKAALAERQKSELTILEKEKTIEGMKKMLEDMKRKSEQGSVQLQGEVQELALEDLLRKSFPFDVIEEVGKGVKGADVIQTVRNGMGESCGKIIYESKRTKAFAKEWIDKLKEDFRAQKADIAILVTEALPRDAGSFTEREGIWICTYHDVQSVAHILRTTLIKMHETGRAQENKGEKMQMLYEFLTGNEFKQQIEAIVEGFSTMQEAVRKEKLMMEKIWKEREKQLDKVLINAVHFYASVKGIAGSSVPDIQLLEGGSLHLPE